MNAQPCAACRRSRVAVETSDRAAVPRQLFGGGQPLSEGVRDFFERRFHHDFGRVRVHADDRAAWAADASGAAAFTIGSDIVFGRGAYVPETDAGRALLAHELTHVVQQRAAQPGASGPGPQHEAEAAAAGDAILRRGADFVVSRASAVGIARQSAPYQRAVTPEIEARLVRELLDARIAAPPSTSFKAEAVRTFAAAAIIEPSGSVRYASAYFDRSGAHAEPLLLRTIEPLVKPGDSVAIAIDQVPCSPTRQNCQAVLRRFATDPNHGSLRVFTVRALRRSVPATTTPSMATPADLVTPKTAIQRPLGERFLFEEKAFQRIRLPIYYGPDPAPGPAGPPTAAGPARTPVPAPAAGGTARQLGRPGIRVAALVGPSVLEAVNRYFMAKEEVERATRSIQARIDQTDIEDAVTSLLARERLAIARRQIRGLPVYVTVSLALSFTNDVLNAVALSRVVLSDRQNNSVAVVVMSHEPLFGTEGKVWYVDVALPVAPVDLKSSERIRLEIDDAIGPAQEGERQRLSEQLQVALAAEERAAQEELARPTVVVDPAKRAEQQRYLTERLNKLKSVQPPIEAPRPSPSGPPASFVALSEPPLTLLPGAPGEDPVRQAAGLADQAQAWAARLQKTGLALRERLSSAAPPSASERRTFFDDHTRWLLTVRAAINALKDRGREEAVTRLLEMLDRRQPGLSELRRHLGGD